MANKTDPFADSIHGTNPQNLIEKITRQKIYNSNYWKEHCFGLTSETIIDKAINLKYCGGVYAGNIKPTPFLCLCLKMLQLQPEKDIIIEYIKNEDFKYLRALGAFYFRMIGKGPEIYKYLEPLYNDYRKLAYRGLNGWQLLRMDEFIDMLLCEELACDVALPFLPKRLLLEESHLLEPRKSILEEEIDDEDIDDIEEDTKNENKNKKNDKQNIPPSSSSSSTTTTTTTTTVTTPIVSKINENIPQQSKQIENNQIKKKDLQENNETIRNQDKDKEIDRDRGEDKDKNKESKKDKNSDKRKDEDYEREKDKHKNKERDRSRDRGKESRRDRSRDRERYRERDRSRERDRRDRSRERDRKHDRDRDRSRERDRSRDRNRDRSREKDKKKERYDKDSDRRSRERNSERNNRRSPSNSPTSHHKNSSPPRPSSPINNKNSNLEIDDDFDRLQAMEEQQNQTNPYKFKYSAKKFDKMFGTKSKSSSSSSNSGSTSTSSKKNAAAEEGSVEYWNQIRDSLGIKKLRE